MGKVALITGSAVRIGHEIATHLAGLGWDLALHYSTSSNAIFKFISELRSTYPEQQFFAFKADFTKIDQTQDVIREVFEQFSKLDLLVNNASVFEPSSLRETSADLVIRQMMVNWISPLVLIRDYADYSNNGLIINIVDTRITNNRSDYLAYSLSKKSLWELTKMAALELGPHFRVNAIAPGAVLPPVGKDRSYLDEVALTTPMKKPSGIDPILKSIEYIIENQDLTGQLIFCNGGSHLF
jgi:NAD(P)-dependent dehydrogenase (short-subunit alcohol dehydrogenase family)